MEFAVSPRETDAGVFPVSCLSISAAAPTILVLAGIPVSGHTGALLRRSAVLERTTQEALTCRQVTHRAMQKADGVRAGCAASGRKVSALRG